MARCSAMAAMSDPAAAIIVTAQTTARLRSTQARAAMRAHARAEVASECRACGEPRRRAPIDPPLLLQPCRQLAYRAGRRPMLAPVAHQRRMRDREAALEPRPQMATLKGCTVEQITYAEAKALIIRYEWLRTMPTVTRACYGLQGAERRACRRRGVCGWPCAGKRRPVRPGTSGPRNLPCARRLRPLGAAQRC